MKRIDLQPGEWVQGEYDVCHCSECGYETEVENISAYCPACGAHMEDEDETD